MTRTWVFYGLDADNVLYSRLMYNVKNRKDAETRAFWIAEEKRLRTVAVRPDDGDVNGDIERKILEEKYAELGIVPQQSITNRYHCRLAWAHPRKRLFSRRKEEYVHIPYWIYARSEDEAVSIASWLYGSVMECLGVEEILEAGECKAKRPTDFM